MATTATVAEIAEARSEVQELESLVTNTRYQLSYATEDDEIDRLAAELTDACRQARIARNIFGDMEAGAGDFYADDED